MVSPRVGGVRKVEDKLDRFPVMKVYGESSFKVPSFSTSSLHEGHRSASYPGLCTLRK
jgi:hypothetical protein